MSPLRPRRSRRLRRGMSLLEVMVAISILLVLSVVTWSVLDATIETRDVLAEQDDITRSGRVTLSRMRRELQLAFLTKHVEAVNTYQTVFVGADGNPDQLWFTSTSHQRLYRDSRESDQTEITIWAEPADEGDGYVLYHREAPRIDEEPDEGGVVYPLAYNVRSFNVRYLDAKTNEWVDEWDTRGVDTANRLPRAVQVGLVLVDEVEEDGRTRTVEIPFVTTIRLERGEELQKSMYNPEAGMQAGLGQGGGR